MQDRSANSDLLTELDIPNEGTLLDPTRRIFVNRNLRFDQIRQVGFDMDYTLAPYVKRNIEELSFQLTAKRMVEHLGYPEEILKLRYDPSFVVRGLAVDKKLGNLFKMDSHNHVGRVFHGRNLVDKETRRKLYRNVKIRMTTPRYHWLDTLFALPEAVLYAEVIELYEQRLGVKKVAFKKLFDDIRSSIDMCHRDGSLKTIIKANIPKYIKADPLLPSTLHKLRSAGKRTWVLTNSYWDYTDAVMSHLLNGKLDEYPTWRNYFDLVIVGAKKPTFFTGTAEFHKINPQTGEVQEAPATRFENRGIYQGGSISRFEQLLEDRGENILYVGDHIYGDIIRSKKDSLWRTALVLEELEHELLLSREQQRNHSDLIALEHQRAALEHRIAALKLMLTKAEQSPDQPEHSGRAKRQLKMALDRRKRDLMAIIRRRDELADAVDRGYNPHWGSVFKEGREASRFGKQVESYACIYTSRVSNFLSYSPTQYFQTPRHWMPHEKE